MAKEAKTTIDHDIIREWVQERDGTPSRVKGTGEKSRVGVLRINFPGYSGEETLEEISWEEFFEEFEDSNLAFLYQDKTSDGEQSRFHKFVSRDSIKEEEEDESDEEDSEDEDLEEEVDEEDEEDDEDEEEK